MKKAAYSPMNEAVMRLPVLVGDEILTRKPHACGGDHWTVIRTGADIKMRCCTCGRLVMLDREAFLRRRKAVLRSGPAPDSASNPASVPLSDPTSDPSASPESEP